MKIISNNLFYLLIYITDFNIYIIILNIYNICVKINVFNQRSLGLCCKSVSLHLDQRSDELDVKNIYVLRLEIKKR